jgi:hypothetical protein
MGTAQQEDVMSFEQLTKDQILCVLENLHKDASDWHEDFGIAYGLSYDESLSLMFHHLWVALKS